jgi:hypothetical protein
VGDFDEEVCSTGHVTLDFAGKRSIVVETDPNGVDTWTLRPVIRLHEAITGCPEDSDHGGSGKSDHNDSAK